MSTYATMKARRKASKSLTRRVSSQLKQRLHTCLQPLGQAEELCKERRSPVGSSGSIWKENPFELLKTYFKNKMEPTNPNANMFEKLHMSK